MDQVMNERMPHRFPKSVLIGAACLIVATVAVTVYFRATTPVPSLLPAGTTEIARELVFEDAAQGAIHVRDAEEGDILAVIPAGEGGFLRTVMRGFARNRKAQQVSPEVPFSLQRRTDGHLILEDRATGRVVALHAFGIDNATAFGRFLMVEGGAQ